MTTVDIATVATPCGPFSLAALGDTVVASGWTDDVEVLMGAIPSPWRPDGRRRRRDLGPLTSAVLDYVAGDLTAIDSVPIGQHSGLFTEHVWEVLRAVPAGAPISYAELAIRSGRPAAVRAAANACGRNSVALFVPCHRVLRTGGHLGGFRWGLDVKRWLLGHEARPASEATSRARPASEATSRARPASEATSRAPGSERQQGQLGVVGMV